MSKMSMRLSSDGIFENAKPHYVFRYSWDEWVPENRVLKYNEANVQRQKEVSKQHQSQQHKNKKGQLYSTSVMALLLTIRVLIY